MWKHLVKGVACGLGLAVVSQCCVAEALKQDNKHVRTWNRFGDEVLRLHRQQLAKYPHSKQTQTGGYAQQPDFYQEERYYHEGRLLSIVQWEKANPKNLHTIEVYLHDSQGRVMRDYTVAYLPVYRNAPVQTLISLHHYQGELHAFRSFDASGYRVIERCTGTLQGREVNLLLDEDEIAGNLGDPEGIMVTAAYRACFGDLAEEAGKYLTPQ